ncbi:pseudogene [Sorangium cellulosum So ce56]|uniref:NAD(P)H-binding protein n=1 Tax=Sorangium cellulosum TaxID=56 RepID=UPI00015FB6E0|nr:NAD(P)H-binding protein [Sorangium cellulosum]CAN94176.1 pseudogene [Sorangium cellulosum So ce56]
MLGAGQIGPRVAELLLAQGHRVRLVQRTRRAPDRPGLTSVCGDITDLAFAEEATRGASVVYDCMNPPYHLGARRAGWQIARERIKSPRPLRARRA